MAGKGATRLAAVESGEGGSLSDRLATAIAENAEMQCRVNESLIARLSTLEEGVKAANACLDQVMQTQIRRTGEGNPPRSLALDPVCPSSAASPCRKTVEPGSRTSISPPAKSRIDPIKNLLETAAAYQRHTIQSLPLFPERAAINLEKARNDQKPPVWLFLPPTESPDAYAEAFATKVGLLGVPVQRVDRYDSCSNGIVVDIGNRLGRRPNRFRGVFEIQQAMVWLGLDFFAHIRSDAIRKAATQFDRLVTVVDKLADDVSGRTAAAIITDQLSGLPLELLSVSMPYDTQYFGTGLFEFSQNEVFVDAGAADGDSLRKFSASQWNFDSWYAFEPDPALARLAAEAVAKCGKGRASLITQPLAERPGPVKFTLLPGTGNSFTTAALDTPGSLVEAVSIDSFLAGRAVSTIKMDVEGSELELLRGACNSIKAFRPKLMISAYHEISHLYEIPELIHSMRSDYRIDLRNHTWAKPTDSWPGAFFCETVVYAY
jgi:FkbM family methyltransferase